MAIGTPTSLGVAITSGNGSATTFSLSLGASITAGNLVVVGVAIDGTSAIAVSSISDGTNTYTKADSINDGGTTAIEYELWYKANASAVSSGTSLNVTTSAAVPAGGYPVGIIAAQVSGVLSVSPLDKTAHAVSTSNVTNVTMTTAALGVASEIVFGFALSAASGLTETQQQSFANIVGGSNAAGMQLTLDYKIVLATTAVTYNPTFSASHPMGGIVATFKFQTTATTMTASVGAYALTGVSANLGKLFVLTASAGSYVLTGISLVQAYIASNPYIRKAAAVLQSLRRNPPENYTIASAYPAAINLLGGTYNVTVSNLSFGPSAIGSTPTLVLNGNVTNTVGTFTASGTQSLQLPAGSYQFVVRGAASATYAGSIVTDQSAPSIYGQTPSLNQ